MPEHVIGAFTRQEIEHDMKKQVDEFITMLDLPTYKMNFIRDEIYDLLREYADMVELDAVRWAQENPEPPTR